MVFSSSSFALEKLFDFESLNSLSSLSSNCSLERGLRIKKGIFFTVEENPVPVAAAGDTREVLLKAFRSKDLRVVLLKKLADDAP